MFHRRKYDQLTRLVNVPSPSCSLSMPLVVSDDSALVFAYYIHDAAESSSTRRIETTKTVNATALGGDVAVVQFLAFTAYRMYPLCLSRDVSERTVIESFSVYRVDQSRWIKKLQESDSTAAQAGQSTMPASSRHFLFTLNAVAMECVAQDFELTVEPGPISAVLPRIVSSFVWYSENPGLPASGSDDR